MWEGGREGARRGESLIAGQDCLAKPLRLVGFSADVVSWDYDLLCMSKDSASSSAASTENDLSCLVVVGANNLTGTIPAWIGNFSSLYVLSLALNNLHGSIPEDLGRLKSLGLFVVWDNNLSGTVPASIYNISSIYYFTVAQNQLQGKIPTDVGTTLPNLVVFAGGVNKFMGSIPLSLSNASALQVLDFAENGLIGGLPLNLAHLRNLSRLNFDDNRLGSGKPGDLDIIRLLSNCTFLEVLGLAGNFFGGELPKSIANLSTRLERFTIGRNVIHGRIPLGIGNLINLTLLGLEGNQLSGSVPVEVGKLQRLNEEQTKVEYGNNRGHGKRRIEECLVSVMHLGLLCSDVDPRERLLMNVVVNKMQAIRKSYLKFKNNGKA
ncbi:hypothetical protein TIFTF001_028706 [Ficus carica]|uniref:Uncharacterized protein n=1 Tax=Ficus carica TaxID=3494 RepID=A0AA88DQE7_FICCA|nr:hypothetical protein TIFTF001_028706 [Ficus carica]